MQILSIHLKNIKSHRDAEFSFSPGINVLSGPNGVGKSTVFEAVGYALFGVDARDFVSNVERFLTIGTKKGEIAVTFQVGIGDVWRVSRTVGTPAKWLLAKKDGDLFEVEEHSRMEETAARIAELLGLDNGRSLADQFKLVIGPFQNEFLGPFVIRQAIKRQEEFDKILGIDHWRKTYKGTASLLSTVQEKIKVLSAEMSVLQEQTLVLPEREAELALVMSTILTRQADLTKAEDSLRQTAERLELLDRQKEQMDAAEHSIKETAAKIESGNEHIIAQKVLVEESAAAAKIVAETRAGKDAFEKAETRLSELREKEKQRRDIEQEVVALEREAERLAQAHEHESRETGKAGLQLAEEERSLTEARKLLISDDSMVSAASKLMELRRELDRMKGERAVLDGRRAALFEGRDKLAEGVCPFFGDACPTVGDERDVFSARSEEFGREMLRHDEIIARLTIEAGAAEKAQQELDALQVRIEELDKQLTLLVEKLRENRERRSNLEQLKGRSMESAAKAAARKLDLSCYAQLDEAIARTEAERAGHQAARDAFQANLKSASDLEIRQLTLEKYRKRLEELQHGLEKEQKDLGQLREAYLPELHGEARRQKEALVADVAAIRQQLENMERDRLRLEGETGKLKQLLQEVKKKGGEKGTYEEKEKLVKFLRNHVFKNVSSQLSERFREEISFRADRIYRTIAETDEELIWGDDYRIVLRDLEEGQIRERSDDQLSGGQTMSAVVALRLALLQTVGARIAFFDEPTSNLDATRRENLAHAFRAIDLGRDEVTEHWYDQLFLISHDVAFTEITDQILDLNRHQLQEG